MALYTFSGTRFFEMNETLKYQAQEIIKAGIYKILTNYTENALLINACFVSAKRYEKLETTYALSTTGNIPPALRLDQEIDFQFTNEELVKEYKSNLIQTISRNYVVMSVSVVDAILEDLYELFLSAFEKDISDQDLSKKVRSAWANDNLINYFVSKGKSGLKRPDDMNTPFEESFMRYKELRIIRHSLVHSNGIVSEKSIETLKEFKERTPPERKVSSIIDSSLIKEGNEIILTISEILLIRQCLHRFLVYMQRSVNSA
jgi:hypothetical protein